MWARISKINSTKGEICQQVYKYISLIKNIFNCLIHFTLIIQIWIKCFFKCLCFLIKYLECAHYYNYHWILIYICLLTEQIVIRWFLLYNHNMLSQCVYSRYSRSIFTTFISIGTTFSFYHLFSYFPVSFVNTLVTQIY